MLLKESRSSKMRKTVSRINKRVQNVLQAEKQALGDQRKCDVCIRTNDSNFATNSVKSKYAPSRPNIIATVPETQKHWFTTAIFQKFYVDRDFAVLLFQQYWKTFVCGTHANVIRHLRDGSLSRERNCYLEGCDGNNCRPLRLPENKTSRRYLEIEDAYACLTFRDASVEEMRDRPVCASHCYILFRGNTDTIGQYLPSGTVGISSLECRSMRDTVLLVRGAICGSESFGKISVLFTKDVYEHYVQKCNSDNAKQMQKNTFLKYVIPVLALYRVFMKTGHELGRGRSFFYNQNKAILEAGEAVLIKKLRIQLCMLEPNEEQELLFLVSKRFRKRRNQYEDVQVNMHDEIAAIPAKLWCDYAVKMCCPRRLARIAKMAKSIGIKQPEDSWPLSNKAVPNETNR